MPGLLLLVPFTVYSTYHLPVINPKVEPATPVSAPVFPAVFKLAPLRVILEDCDNGFITA